MLACEDESLLVGRNALLVLNFGFDIVDCVGRFDFESDGLASEGFDENLHSSTETKDEVEGGFLLNVVVGKGSTVLELFSGKNQALLVWWDSFFVLNLGFHVIDGVRGLDFEGDGFAGESLDKNLHPSPKTEDEVKSRLLLDVVIRESTTVFKLLSSKDQTLLIRRNAFLVLNLAFDIVDCVRGFNLQRDGCMIISTQTKRRMREAYSCQ